MKSGETVVFDGSGHAKSKGLEFSIKVPKSWAMKEGGTPNIVQKFYNENGTGSVQLHIISRTLPSPSTPEILENLYSEPAIRNVAEQLGTSFIRSSSSAIDGEPAGYCEYRTEKGWMGGDFCTHGCFFIVCWETTMIHFNFVVGKKGKTDEQAAIEFAEYLPVFRAITNSFVLKDKRK